MQISENMSVMEKLRILTDAAKYDVACTSSGTSRGMTVQGSEAVCRWGFATVLRQTADVSLCLRSFLPMNVFLIVSIVLTGGVMMCRGHLLLRMRFVSSR